MTTEAPKSRRILFLQYRKFHQILCVTAVMHSSRVHYLSRYVRVVDQSFLTLCDPVACRLPGFSVHGDFPSRILEWVVMPSSKGSSQLRDWTQVSCIAVAILYHLSHQGSPRILEWVAYPFSRGFSWSRNWTRVSCTAGWFFTSWAIREAHLSRR